MVNWPWQPEGYDSGDYARDNFNLNPTPTPNELVNDPSLARNSSGFWSGAMEALGPLAPQTSDAVLEAANEYKWQHGKAALTTLGAKPYRFNAPLHPSMRKSQSGSPYDTTYGSGDLRTDWDEKSGRKPWRWRVGQLVADASSAAYKPGDYRYGFRFLYNPTSISFSTPQTSKYSIAALANSAGLESRMLARGMN